MKQQAGVVTPSRSTAPATGAPRDSTRRLDAGNGNGSGTGAMLWAVDLAGRLSAIRVHTGLTDGQKTAVNGPKLAEGMKVITSMSSAAGAATTASSNPLQPQRPQGGGRGGF